MVNITKGQVMFTDKNISAYLADHKDTWAESTIRSKQSLLKKMKKSVGNCSQQKAIDYIEANYKPYSQKTNLIHLSAFTDWLIREGKIKGAENGFAGRIRKASFKFKSAYEKRLPEITFKEAQEKINSITDSEVRRVANILLHTGLRISELWKVDHEQGTVMGKGSKRRSYIGDTFDAPKVSVTWIRLKLAEVGLKPHDLRKVFATFLVENNYQIQEICSIMGWSSFDTAQFYLIVRAKDELKQRLKLDMRNTVNGGREDERWSSYT